MCAPKPSPPITVTPVTDQDQQEQADFLKAFLGTTAHSFGSWHAIFGDLSDPRNPQLITYPLASLLFTGVLMFLFRLGARREIKHKLRGNRASEAKFKALFGPKEVPHGDTLNYSFKKLETDHHHLQMADQSAGHGKECGYSGQRGGPFALENLY